MSGILYNGIRRQYLATGAMIPSTLLIDFTFDEGYVISRMMPAAAVKIRKIYYATIISAKFSPTLNLRTRNFQAQDRYSLRTVG